MKGEPGVSAEPGGSCVAFGEIAEPGRGSFKSFLFLRPQTNRASFTAATGFML